MQKAGIMPPTHRVAHNPHLAYRPDIDGLRALAIITVVIFHVFPRWLPGGFVGVDIFFVISGYLITGIILKAQSGEGFSLSDFYSRRIKRIFPALIVVLAFCLVAGWYGLLADEYKALGKNIAAGAAYVSNHVFLAESGYFDVAAGLKPLLHLWSLAIEDQFYLVWPLMLILALRGNLNPLMLIGLVLAISFSLNVANIEHRPEKVFYLAITRSWELAIGAMLAYINIYKRDVFDQVAGKVLLRNPHRAGNDLANVLAWIGLTLVLMAAVGLNKGLPYPGWWALFPTLGAACLIAAGEQSWINRRILASRFAVYVGLISYPLYLWHWPLLSFAHILEGETPSLAIRLSVVVLSTLLAWVTNRLIEKPLRFRRHRAVAPGLFVVLALIGIVGYQVYRQAGYTPRFPQAERVARGVGALAWDNQGWNQQSTCTEKFGKEFEQYCEVNDISRSPTVALIGDSNANQFYPGLAKMYAIANENLLNLGQGGCPPFYGLDARLLNASMQGRDLHCEIARDKALNFAIETTSVKTVVLSLMGVAYATGNLGLNGGAQGFIRISYPHDRELTTPLAMLEDAMRITLRRLVDAGKHVVFVISVPMLDFDPASCVDFRPWRITAAKLRTPCAISRKKVDSLSAGYRVMVTKVLREFPQVKVWDASRALCDEKYCWAIKDGALLYRDADHLNEAGSYFVGERIPLEVIEKTSGQ
jgi:peptidoglycan/LPS O-acetylase OafA/YrhL